MGELAASGDETGISFGSLSANDTSFRALTLLLATHPSYANIPMVCAVDVWSALQSSKNLSVVRNESLVGTILWRDVSRTTAARCICERRLPRADEAIAVGEAAVATAFIAPGPAEVSALWEKFKAVQAGKVVMYERHRAGRPSRFTWLDRTGRRFGDQI
jgi:hypothetical protein